MIVYAHLRRPVIIQAIGVRYVHMQLKDWFRSLNGTVGWHSSLRLHLRVGGTCDYIFCFFV